MIIITGTTGKLLVVCAAAILLMVPGCCTRQKKPVKTSGEVVEKKDSLDKKSVVKKSLPEDNGSDPESHAAAVASQRRANRAKLLNRKLENAYEMFKKDNTDAALRELERLQREIDNDPHLEMQTWYLSAMIYHKTGKSSRRKRAMRKMLESMEQLQKDPRFLKAYEDGMMGKEVIDMALKKGEGKYVE